MNNEIKNNLPDRPYRKFFGRSDALKKIEETLLEGATFIASIDGVGGIGKTALAHFFCENKILPTSEYKYLVWITSKSTVFDPFSKDQQIKSVVNAFNGVETLIDTTLSVMELEDFIPLPMKDKEQTFLNEILNNESIFFVLDNLENIYDDSFFTFVTKNFNKLAKHNQKIKILTTSRKRKKLVDFPVEIEGLTVEDSLMMLKHLAREYGIKDILNSNDHDNIKLIDKVGRIPLGIEFIIGQMTLGKSRGQIYSELEGYPNLVKIEDQTEKKKRLSDILFFSFKDMYETLNDNQKKTFQVIASLEKNKNKEESPVSFELLMAITELDKVELENILDILTDNKLITTYDSNEYSINQMAINFVKQYFENFESIEDEVIGKKRKIVPGANVANDKVSIFLNNVKSLTEDGDYPKAESELIKALEVSQDFRIYFELAKIQEFLKKYTKASDNYRTASTLNSNDFKVWSNWIHMEDIRGRYNIALDIIERALKSTNYDVNILSQKLNILKFKKEYIKLREVVKENLDLYKKGLRNEDVLRLLKYWKQIEFNLLNSDAKSNYIEAIEQLIQFERAPETKLNLLYEELKVIRKLNLAHKEIEVKRKIQNLNHSILDSMGNRSKNLNKLFSSHKYEEAKSEARKILNWIGKDNQNENYAINALRVLLHVLASEKDFDRIVITFDDYKQIAYKDDNCVKIFERAKKEKNELHRNGLIEKISSNIQNSEYYLRNLIMQSLENDEESLKTLIMEKGKSEWLEQWQQTKSRALKQDAMLIHYSDLSHVRSILSWCKNNIVSLGNSNNHYAIKEKLKNVVGNLEKYVSQERNETFHSRLQLLENEKLNEFVVDTNRIHDLIKELKDLTSQLN